MRSLIELEDFLHGLGWLDGMDLDRALIVTGEVLDNIVGHSARRPFSRVHFRVRKGRRTTILALFKEREFASFVANLDKYAPYFDEKTHRQRGLGLLLCERLSGRIRYRSGTVWQSVLIEL